MSVRITDESNQTIAEYPTEVILEEGMNIYVEVDGDLYGSMWVHGGPGPDGTRVVVDLGGYKDGATWDEVEQLTHDTRMREAEED